MTLEEVKEFLDEKTTKYNSSEFIETDPVSIPHRYSKKEDIEISGLLAATLSWGNRKAIVKSTKHLMELMDDAPYDFVINARSKDLQRLEKFVYRTFNGFDALFFIKSIKDIYINHGGLESVFTENKAIKSSLAHFRSVFMRGQDVRTGKHVANVLKGSSAKRLNMYLRWMIRGDKMGVDFGLWKGLDKSDLYLPLDVHTGNVGRKLGLLQRKQSDWKAVEEITNVLRTFDSVDPIKYDFALFGLGVFEKF